MIAVDSNVLLYAEGLDDAARQTRAKAVLSSIYPTDLTIPAQALGEVFRVLIAKGGMSAGDARRSVLNWTQVAVVPPTSMTTLFSALDLAHDHRFQIWDAIIVAASAEAGARILLSEDVQSGFTWRGLTVVNPFDPGAEVGLLEMALGGRL
jgi:predicted nucleic acid-binding protein